MRDIKRCIEQYEKKFGNDAHGNGAFYASDLQQIKEMAKGNGKSDMAVLFDAIQYALEAGFQIGYRKGLKDARA